MNVDDILSNLSRIYAKKISPNFTIVVKLILRDKKEDYYILAKPEKKVTIESHTDEQPNFTLITTKQILRKIYDGELAALTAMGREHISDKTPLDFLLPNDVSMTPKLYHKLISFVQHFFNRFEPEKIKFGANYSRLVHGGHAVPLFYDKAEKHNYGFRSSWYLLKEDEQLNEPEDTNSFPQGIIVISGSGSGRIGNQTIHLQQGEAYYIPPDTEHYVWTDKEEITLIWLAWGEGA